jgi:hypothetical protein
MNPGGCGAGVGAGRPEAGATEDGKVGLRGKDRDSLPGGRRQGGTSSSESRAAPAFDQGLSGVAQPFTRLRPRASAPSPPSAAPVSPECPDSSTACSSLAPAEATVWLQWR